MKLSEAMMLPTDVKFNSKYYLSCGEGCLIGQAMNVATGTKHCSLKVMIEYWPWLSESFPTPDEIRGPLLNMAACPSVIQGERVITRFAFAVEAGVLTREQCADWVRANEPETPSAGENEAEAGKSTNEAEKGLISAR